MAMWIPEKSYRGGMIPGHWQEDKPAKPAKRTERRWVEPQAARGGMVKVAAFMYQESAARPRHIHAAMQQALADPCRCHDNCNRFPSAGI